MKKHTLAAVLILSLMMIISSGCFLFTGKAQAETPEGVTIILDDNGLNAFEGGTALTESELADMGISFSEGLLEIGSEGTYILSGTFEGTIAISSSKKSDVVLVLDGLTLTNPDDEALTVKKTGNLTIYLNEGTQNVITSGTETVIGPEEETAAEENTAAEVSAVHLKADTVITGTGSLVINGYINNGLDSSKSLTIESGDLTISAVNNGIKVKDTLIINGGTIDVLSGNDGIKAETEETAATEAVTDVETGEILIEASEGTEAAGTIIINGGDIMTDSYGDAIQANLSLTVNGGNITVKTEGEAAQKNEFRDSRPGQSSGNSQTDSTSEKGLKSSGTITINGGIIYIDTVDDAIHSAELITVNGGDLTISSGDDAIHSDTQIDIKDGKIFILSSYEGIEANQINVAGGDISLAASDDGFNANGGSQSFGGPGGSRGSESSQSSEMPNLNISGGTIYVNASGDGLDSNGNITVTGGITIVDGPVSSMNGALDAGMENGGQVTVSDGTVFAWGASGMAESFDSSSTQPSFILTFSSTYQAGTEIKILSEDGTELFSHTVESSGNCLVFTSPNLTEDGTCVLTVGDKEYEFTLSGITTRVTVSANDAVTTQSGNNGGMSWGGQMPENGMQGGGMQGGGMQGGGMQGGQMPEDGSSDGGMSEGGQMPENGSSDGGMSEGGQVPENGSSDGGMSEGGQTPENGSTDGGIEDA